MKTTPETILTVSALAFVAATGCASAEILINQRSAGFAEPSASIMSGRGNTSDANASAEASKAAGDWFSSGPTGTFLSLSEKHPQQRATAIYDGAGEWRGGGGVLRRFVRSSVRSFVMRLPRCVVTPTKLAEDLLPRR